jgi:hypothetical protein
VAVRLSAAHRQAYRRLYARYCTILDGLPVLRDRDFDGRAVKMTRQQLAALNAAFASAENAPNGAGAPRTVFEAQQDQKTRLFKRTQYLS